MDSYRVDKWRPTFPSAVPPHWVAFVSRGASAEVASDVPLRDSERIGLRSWLSKRTPRHGGDEASYIYFGLSEDWCPLGPGGVCLPEGVVGEGSGIGMGEPEGAVPATVAELYEWGLIALSSPGRTQSGGIG